MDAGPMTPQLSLMPKVQFGCGIAGMLSLDPGSASLVLVDLPSGETSAEFDKPVDLPSFWSAAWHALAPAGQIVVVASSIRFAAALIASQPEHFRYDLVWEKSLAVGFLSAAHRPLRAHEFILLFSREVGTYNPVMLDGFVPISRNNRDVLPRSTEKTTESYGGSKAKRGMARAGATDRFPRSVLHFGSVPTKSTARSHPHQKPEQLLSYLVRQYSNPGDHVLDPCAGSGSTGLAAQSCGRRFLGWDISPRFGSP
jgi:site-specific DNA-methyltransferase (adenine-specific)